MKTSLVVLVASLACLALPARAEAKGQAARKADGTAFTGCVEKATECLVLRLKGNKTAYALKFAEGVQVPQPGFAIAAKGTVNDDPVGFCMQGLKELQVKEWSRKKLRCPATPAKK
jgi:hypothetical protein